VLDVIGQVSQPAFREERGVTKIDLSGFPTGMYFLRISDGSKTITLKFIKE
jgi:hypothetical protein